MLMPLKLRLLLPIILTMGGLLYADATATAQTRTLTDTVGREVLVPAEIHRLVVVDSFASEIIIMSGGGDLLAACPDGVQSNKLLQQLCPGITNAANVNQTGALNTEAMLALAPDLIIIKQSFFAKEAQANQLVTLGIPYIIIDYADVEAQIKAIRLLGEIMGGQPQKTAEDIAAYYTETLKLVQAKAAQIPPSERKAVYHAVNAFNFTSGQNFGSAWIEYVGGVNVAHANKATGTKDFSINMEYIFIWNPAAIICNEAQTAEMFRSDERLKQLPAVRQGQLFNIPVGITRWGHPLSAEKYFAMLWLGVNLYPSYYADIDLKKEVITFYGKLGLTVDDDLYSQIISGEGLRPPRRKDGAN